MYAKFHPDNLSFRVCSKNVSFYQRYFKSWLVILAKFLFTDKILSVSDIRDDGQLWLNGWRVRLVTWRSWVRVGISRGVNDQCSLSPSIPRLRWDPWARHRTPNCSGCVFAVCVCVCESCVYYSLLCALGWVKCRAEILSMGYHTWQHVTTIVTSSLRVFIPKWRSWYLGKQCKCKKEVYPRVQPTRDTWSATAVHVSALSTKLSVPM